MIIDSDTTLRDLGRVLARLPGRPDLTLRCDDGCWWAVLGDRRTGHGILHSGLTPADAIAGAIETATDRREETAP